MPQALCINCSALTLKGPQDELIGPYNTLLSNAQSTDPAVHCPSCLFFTNMLHADIRNPDELKDKIVYLNSYYLHVRDADDQGSGCYSAGELLLEVVAGEAYEGQFTEENYDEEGKLLGLPVERMSVLEGEIGDQACLDKIGVWMGECMGMHGGACGSNTKAGEMKVRLPGRVIKVPSDEGLAPRIMQTAGEMGEYLALSAIGHYAETVPEGEILEIEMCDGLNDVVLDMKTLPKTYADAISITRSLNYEYIYIAALCQPPAATTGTNSVLDLIPIFGNAALLIAACASASLSSGIFQKRHIPISPGLGPNKDLHLRSHYVRLVVDAEESALAARGWAFIERVLAPRVVHFTQKQLIWECGAGWQLEATGVPNRRYGSGQVRDRYQKKGMQGIVREYLMRNFSEANGQVPHEHAEDVDDIDKGNEVEARYASRLEAWFQFQNTFASCKFSSPADTQLALTPIVHIFDNGTLGSYLGGCWEKDFALHLTWCRQYRMLTSPPSYRAPSWSWLCVDGARNNSSMHWPTDIVSNKRHAAWAEKYAARLLDKNLLYTEEGNAYSTLKKGSSITVEASVVPLMEVSSYFSREKGGELSPNLILDKSSIFDCPCCGPKADEKEKEETERFGKSLNECKVMVAQGNVWGKDTGGRGSVNLLVLRKVDCDGEGYVGAEHEEVYVRIGLLALSCWVHLKEGELLDTETLDKQFNGAGWEKKVLKLI